VEKVGIGYSVTDSFEEVKLGLDVSQSLGRERQSRLQSPFERDGLGVLPQNTLGVVPHGIALGRSEEKGPQAASTPTHDKVREQESRKADPSAALAFPSTLLFERR